MIPFGSIKKTCPFCGKDIEDGQSRVTWGGDGIWLGMTVHRTWSDQRKTESEEVSRER